MTTTDTSSLLHLLWLSSPALPIGGFSYSEGLEAGVDAGLVCDEASAGTWLKNQLLLSLARGDLAAMAQAMPAWQAHDWPRVRSLNDWVVHTRETEEMRRQSEQMGRSLAQWAAQFDAQHTQTPAALAHQALGQAQLQPPTYPLVAAAVAAFSGAPCSHALTAHAFAWAENQVQAAIKAVPLGQSAGQRILAMLVGHIPGAVQTAQQATDETRQVCAPMLAIHSAMHETQYSRLFRS